VTLRSIGAVSATRLSKIACFSSRRRSATSAFSTASAVRVRDSSLCSSRCLTSACWALLSATAHPANGADGVDEILRGLRLRAT
jgi:hypothetical protein